MKKQFVFEVRIRPGTYKVQENTLAKNLWPHRRLPYDLKCSTRGMEWLIMNCDDIVCTGVMIRQLPVRATDYNRERQRGMKAHVQWSDEESRALRPRDHGAPFGAPHGVAWEVNTDDDDWSPLELYGEHQWTRYAPMISELIENAYQEYQRFCFIGVTHGAAPYYIDFRGLCNKGSGNAEQRRADADKEQAWRRRTVRRVAVEGPHLRDCLAANGLHDA